MKWPTGRSPSALVWWNRKFRLLYSATSLAVRMTSAKWTTAFYDSGDKRSDHLDRNDLSLRLGYFEHTQKLHIIGACETRQLPPYYLPREFWVIFRWQIVFRKKNDNRNFTNLLLAASNDVNVNINTILRDDRSLTVRYISEITDT